VVEGSALGARVIGRSVSVSLGVTPGHGGSFFCGATADAARIRWHHFAAALDWAEPRLGDAGSARVTETAIAVFAKLEQTFVRSAVPPHKTGASSSAHLSSAASAARILN
jgi:heme oxygenase